MVIQNKFLFNCVVVENKGVFRMGIKNGLLLLFFRYSTVPVQFHLTLLRIQNGNERTVRM